MTCDRDMCFHNLWNDIPCEECPCYEEMIEAVEKDAAAGIWVTKDSRELKISEMQTSHIKNCINFIKRNDDDMYACYIPIFEAELKRRGEEI